MTHIGAALLRAIQDLKGLGSGLQGLSIAFCPPCIVSNPSLILSVELFLVYVLRLSGCRGLMTAGSVKRIAPNKIDIFDEHGRWLEYFSGDALRSWCVLNELGMPHEDWKAVHPEDENRVVSRAGADLID